MREVIIPEEKRKQYEWFESFSNPCYSMDVPLDVTKIVRLAKEKDLSFFVIMLYVVTRTLNELDDMRMRYVNKKPVIYDVVNPSYTVMTKANTYDLVRHKYIEDFASFYQVAKEHIERAKNMEQVEPSEYNLPDRWNEFYITCVPWTAFSCVTQPIPDDKSSSSIPRICWGKFLEKDNGYTLTLNLTVSHMFIEGFVLCSAFNNIQAMLDEPEAYINLDNVNQE